MCKGSDVQGQIVQGLPCTTIVIELWPHRLIFCHETFYACSSSITTSTRRAGWLIQSDPDLPGLDLPEPRFTGRINFPRYRKLTVFNPDIPGTPIYRVNPYPPSIPVNRDPTVYANCDTLHALLFYYLSWKWK